MSYQTVGNATLNYFPCRYGSSKLLFRGPKKKLEGDYVAFLGGSETYGKYVEMPYVDVIDGQLENTVVNFGCVNAGVDVFLQDRTVLEICAKAAVTVIELPGAINISNRFYSVHPRRNDRFLHASPLLSTIYRGVDFTEFNFTRHMLNGLKEESVEKFEMVRQELREAWLARMDKLLDLVHGKVVLLWAADHSPDDLEATQSIRRDPTFVTRAMLDKLKPKSNACVEVVAAQSERKDGLNMMVYPEFERTAAEHMLGPIVHANIADALSGALSDYVT